MRHRRTVPKLGRIAPHRDAMLRGLVTDFLRVERVRTTQAKAKALRPLAERMITLGKRETLHARRQAARVIRDPEVVRKLFSDLAPRYAERPGGYTRIVKLPARSGDNAAMAMIELVEAEIAPKKASKKTAKKKAAKKKAAKKKAAKKKASKKTARVKAAKKTSRKKSAGPRKASQDAAAKGPEKG